MTTNAHITAQGASFWHGVDSGGITYTQVAGIDGLSNPSKKRKALDVTTQDQDTPDMQYVGSVLIENDLPALELLFNPADAGQTALYGDFASAEPVPYKVQASNGDAWTFLGVITDWSPAGKKGELVKVKVTIKISGPVTFTAD